MKVVPELLCRDIQETKRFYLEVLGFEIKYERLEETFAYFTLDGVDVMVEQVDGPGRRWITAAMEIPFGRGINLQWDVGNLQELYQRVKSIKPDAIYLDLERKTYVCGERTVEQEQFIVQDPNGYLFRFCEALDE